MQTFLILFIFFGSMNHVVSKSLDNCWTNCISANETFMAGQAACDCPLTLLLDIPLSSQENWMLLCRSRMSVSFTDKNMNSTIDYIVLMARVGESPQLIQSIKQPYFTVTNLRSNTLYNFHFISVINEVGELGSVQNIYNITTIEVLDTVRNLSIDAWIPGKEEVSARVIWIAGDNSGCHFDLVWQNEMDGRMGKKEIRKVEDLYTVVIDHLSYNSNYNMIMTAVDSYEGKYVESIASNFLLTTPRCFEINENTTNICLPEMLTGLTVIEVNKVMDLYDIQLQWDPPEDQVTLIFAEIEDMEGYGNGTFRKSVYGNKSTITFIGMALKESFKVRAWASSAAGYGPTNVLVWFLDPDDTTSDALGKLELIIIIFSCAFTVSAAVTVIYLRLYRIKKVTKESELKEKQRSLENVESPSEPVHKISLTDNTHEIARDDLTLLGILGEGAFGIVRKALLTHKGSKKDVAVKMLKAKPSNDEKEQLLQELHMLQSLGQHDHVVSLVAYVTSCRVEDILLVVEYCSQGDLRHYLQNAHLSAISHYQENHLESKNDGVSNQLYGVLANEYCLKLTKSDLISFAWQVADGMEFLSNNRIIHRDLAARNVLVTAHRNLKISDFGLSRDVYESNCYTKTSNGRVPLKWMAIESLLYQKYTIQSDVWSFGVLLWEVMTFGSMPYSDISPLNLIEYLGKGKRLPRPHYSSLKLYVVMLSCWKINPSERPRFSDLKKTLDEILKAQIN